MILCCGEALIDFVPMEGGLGYRPFPGGSIFNIAIGLSRLGTPAGLFTKLSTDYFGQLLVDTLVKNGVQTGRLLRADGPTTLAFVSLPGEGVYEPQYLFYDSLATDRSLLPADLPESLPEEVEALHFGSISLVLEPGASTLEALMKQESKQRILSLDPNIRPSLIPDRAAYCRRFESWLSLVDILRLSQADLEWLYPGTPCEKKIQEWLQGGPCLCLLTLGDRGAVAFTNDQPEVSVPALEVVVADTVGAGDTFQAASLSWLFRQRLLNDRTALERITTAQLGECLQFAVRAAAINCSRPGADPPYLHEME